MSLYQQGFKLIDPPPRSTFSFSDESTRCILPDFATSQDLTEFVKRLWIFHFFIEGIFTQIKVIAAVLCLLIVLVALILGKRFITRSFWIVRLTQLGSGKIVTPNALIWFSIIEGAYGILLIAFLFLICRWYEPGQQNDPPRAFFLLWCLTWLPTFVGAQGATLGTRDANPSSMRSNFNQRSRQSLWQRLRTNAMLINFITFGSTISVIISIVVPAALGDKQYQRMLTRQEDWMNSFGNSTTFSEEATNSALSIWYDSLKVIRYATITFIIWSVWAILLFIAFTRVAYGLISTIGKELNRGKSGKEIMLTTQHQNEIEQIDSQPELAPPQTNNSPQIDVERKASDATIAVNEYHGKRVSLPPSTKNTSNLVIRKKDPIPPWKARQMNALRKVRLHLIIQLLSVAPAAFIFFMIALYLAVISYGSYEIPLGPLNPGLKFERYLSVALLVVAWTSVFFGSIIFAAIAAKVYESDLISLRHHQNNHFNNEEEDEEEQNSSPARNYKNRLSLRLPRPFPSALRSEEDQRSVQQERQIGIMSSFFETQSKNQKQRGQSSNSPACIVEETTTTFEEENGISPRFGLGLHPHNFESRISDDGREFFSGGNGRNRSILSNESRKGTSRNSPFESVSPKSSTKAEEFHRF